MNLIFILFTVFIPTGIYAQEECILIDQDGNHVVWSPTKTAKIQATVPGDAKVEDVFYTFTAESDLSMVNVTQGDGNCDPSNFIKNQEDGKLSFATNLSQDQWDDFFRNTNLKTCILQVEVCAGFKIAFNTTVEDANGHNPAFEQKSYTFNVPVPILKGYSITQLTGQAIIATDGDFSTQEITCAFNTDTLPLQVETSKDGNNFLVDLVFTDTWYFTTQQVVELTASDDGNPPRHGIAYITFKVDPANSDVRPPVFSEPFPERTDVEDGEIIYIDMNEQYPFATVEITKTFPQIDGLHFEATVGTIDKHTQIQIKVTLPKESGKQALPPVLLGISVTYKLQESGAGATSSTAVIVTFSDVSNPTDSPGSTDPSDPTGSDGPTDSSDPTESTTDSPGDGGGDDNGDGDGSDDDDGDDNDGNDDNDDSDGVNGGLLAGTIIFAVTTLLGCGASLYMYLKFVRTPKPLTTDNEKGNLTSLSPTPTSATLEIEKTNFDPDNNNDHGKSKEDIDVIEEENEETDENEKTDYSAKEKKEAEELEEESKDKMVTLKEPADRTRKRSMTFSDNDEKARELRENDNLTEIDSSDASRSGSTLSDQKSLDTDPPIKVEVTSF